MSEMSRAAPRRRRSVILLGIVGVLALTGLVFLTGFAVGEYRFFPYSLLDRVESKLRRIAGADGPDLQEEPVLQDTRTPTALLNLQIDVGRVETGRPPQPNPIRQNGGGLTQFGEDVLLLAYNGRIYAASGPDTIRETGIVAPDNNRAAYQALEKDPDFARYNFNAHYLRYNDLEYFDTGSEKGLIASYSEYHPDEVCTTNTLARLDFPPGTSSIDAVGAGSGDWEVIYRTTPCLPFKTRNLALEGHMASGKIAIAPEGRIYLSSGDFHWDGMRSDGAPIAQDPQAEYGKVLEMSLDGSDAQIMTMGHRNVQGMVRAPDGRIFTAEHGPKGGDEVNILQPGANFGWPLESYGISYNGGRIPGSLSFGRHEGFPAPLFAWVPSVATSGIAYIDGFHPAWDGDLLVANLIDRSLYRIRLEGDRAVYGERIGIGQRVREVEQLDDGRIVLWTDNQEMLFLTPHDLEDVPLTVADFAAKAKLNADLTARLETEMARCAECHSLQTGDHQKAPSLARIHGDPIAATSYEGYTEALKAKSGTWDDATLAGFLIDPQGFAPGTTMSGLEDPDLAEHVVRYLHDLDWRAF